MNGTHGTNYGSAVQIINNGFNASSSGRRGVGVYFWDYTCQSSQKFARHVAACFWRMHQSKRDGGAYKGNASCVIIKANIDASYESQAKLAIDLQHPEYCYALQDYIREAVAKLPHEKRRDPREVGKVYEKFCMALEKKIGAEIVCVRCFITFPEKWLKFVFYQGNPTCLVVRDSSKINIRTVECRSHWTTQPPKDLWD